MTPLASACLLALTFAAHSAVADVSFNRDIRPILSDRCFKCHGPDGGEHGELWKGGLRLDTRTGALADLVAAKHAIDTRKRKAGGLGPRPAPKASRRAIIPGDAEASLLVQRIMSDDETERMPPPDSHLALSEREKKLLVQWIKEGATWEGHWAFQPILRPTPPIKKDPWISNEIDAFVLARLNAAKITPAPPADRVTWLRRVTQDLTGLPPTLADIAAFKADQSPEAHRKVVDRLLSSVDYAERMTAIWLDNARYADSNGYQFDNERTMWPWRDWVIEAFRANRPYDQFVTEQLAGDLLPDAGLSQRIATGFNRNHGYSIEGGIIDEEYRVTYANDKTTTAGTLFLGLTLECTRCHDHKYDPLTMKDYYSLFAFFNNSAEKGAPGENGRKQKSAPPYISYTPSAPKPEKATTAWQVLKPRDAKAETQTLTAEPAGFVLAGGDNPANDNYRLTFQSDLNKLRSLRLEARRHPSMTGGALSRSSSGNFVLSDITITLINREDRKTIRPVRATASFEQKGFPVAHAIDADPKSGWAVHGGVDRDQQAVFILDAEVPISPETEVEIQLKHESPHTQHNLGYFRLSASSREEADPPGSTKPSALAMVMEEKPRPSFVLNQGLFDQPGEAVVPDTPGILPAFDGFARNRLGLAQWLVTPDNPLFARVTVNRIWQQFFGQGIVTTPDNFGLQGDPPSHPDLLDWLAADFREHDWDLHHLIRTIVLSSTYRQTSDFRPELQDPENRRLARGPTFRLPAEMIRDQALAIGGLLSPKVGGPSVRPYQPDGVWEDLNAPKSHAEVYVANKGEALYRKTMYGYWRRAVLHPALQTFDAPSRDVCTVKRERTNTPLQALITLHDPTYIEAARNLAEDLLSEKQPIRRAFQTMLSRDAEPDELKRLAELYEGRLRHYRENPATAKRLLQVGASSAQPSDRPAELAALTNVCHTIFNLSETITRK